MGDDVTIRFGIKNAKTLRGIERVRQSVSTFKKDAQGTFSGLGLFGGLSAAAFLAYLNSVATQIDNIDKRAKQLNATAEDTQRLEFIARQNKADIDLITDGLLRMSRILGDLDKNKNAAKALEQLNLEAKEFRKLKPNEQLFALEMPLRLRLTEARLRPLSTSCWAAKLRLCCLCLKTGG